MENNEASSHHHRYHRASLPPLRSTLYSGSFLPIFIFRRTPRFFFSRRPPSPYVPVISKPHCACRPGHLCNRNLSCAFPAITCTLSQLTHPFHTLFLFWSPCLLPRCFLAFSLSHSCVPKAEAATRTKGPPCPPALSLGPIRIHRPHPRKLGPASSALESCLPFRVVPALYDQTTATLFPFLILVFSLSRTNFGFLSSLLSLFAFCASFAVLALPLLRQPAA